MKVVNTDTFFKDHLDIKVLIFFGNNIVINKDTKEIFYNERVFFDSLKNNIKRIYLDQNSFLLIVCLKDINDIDLSKHNLEISTPRSLLPYIDSYNMCNMLSTFQWVIWNNKTTYCSRCSEKLAHVSDTVEKVCNSCDIIYYPNLPPAVMVLIEKDNKILLARHKNKVTNIFTVIAGFVDIGESAEQAAIREVKEETNLVISDLQYFGTQSWSVSGSFMIAFKAKYVSGEIDIDKDELVEARWFDKDKLPEDLPPKISISRKMIDSFNT